MREIQHRIETLSHFIERIRRGETPSRLVWPAFVVDEEGKMVSQEERERILREHGIHVELDREPDVYSFEAMLSKSSGE